MPEDVNNADPGTAQTTPAGDNSPTADGGQTNTPDSAELANLVQSQVAEQFKALRNSLFAEVRRISKPGASQKPTQQNGDGDAEATIADRLKVLEEEKAQVDADRRENAIRSALTSSGVPSERQDIALDHLERRIGSKIAYDRDTRKVVYREFEGDSAREVADYIKDFLKTPTGEIFLPAPATGQLPNGRNKSGGGKPPYADLPAEKRLSMTFAEQAAYVAANG